MVLWGLIRIGAQGMDFNVPEELVLRVMNFSALDSGLVFRAWILVLGGMNWGSVECLSGSLGRLLGFAGSPEVPRRVPGGPKAHFGIQLQRNQ